MTHGRGPTAAHRQHNGIQRLDAARAEFLLKYPEYEGHRPPRRAARVGVRPARRAGPGLSRLHRRRPVRRLAGPRSTRSCSRARVRQPALGEPDLDGDDARWSRAHAARGARLLQRAPATTPRSSPLNASAALKLVGESYPFAPGGALSADRRQSQLGQRHPRVRARERRAVDYAPLTVPELCASTSRSSSALLDARRPVARQPVRVSRAVEFLRREASARPDRARAHARGWDVLLDAAAFVPTNRLDLTVGQARLRRRLVLQDVRLPDRRRLPAGPQRDVLPRCAARGSPAARSTSRPCRDARTCCRRAKPASRTAR